MIEYLHPATGELVRKDFWISDPATTNNRMALHSVIEAFRILSAKGRRLRVIFTTDSNYIVKGMTEWVPVWESRGWTRKGGAIENVHLWKRAVEAVRAHDAEWVWVRGHDGHPQNEYANDIAVRAARELSSSGGAVESGFAEWLASREARGATRGPMAFPPDAPRSLPRR